MRLRPRVLIDVSKRSTKCNILGLELDLPVAIAPTAMQKMATGQGEKASARGKYIENSMQKRNKRKTNFTAASNIKTIYTLSTLSTSSIEEVAEASPDSMKWYQLYIYKDRELSKNLVRRAEAAGFKALVLTVDAPLFGIRRSDIRNQFQLPEHLQLANFLDNRIAKKVDSEGGSGIQEYVSKQFDATLNWNDVKWLVK